jgi:hypothetical protein
MYAWTAAMITEIATTVESCAKPNFVPLKYIPVSYAPAVHPFFESRFGTTVMAVLPANKIGAPIPPSSLDFTRSEPTLRPENRDIRFR